MRIGDVESILRELGRQFQFRYDLPLEMEQYFEGILGSYEGSREHVAHWLFDRVKADFLTLGRSPQWKQDPEWPIFRDRPMIFIGQIDRVIASLDVSFYLFKDHKSGVTKVVTQTVGEF